MISNTGRRRARAARRQGPARQRLVRVLRAARQPADGRRGVPRARRFTARTRRRSRTTSSTRSSPRRKGGRCRRPPTPKTLRLDYKDPYAKKSAAAPVGGQTGSSDSVRATALPSHRLGAGHRHSRAVRARRGDDQQHDRRSDARHVAHVHHAALRHRARPGRDGLHADARLPHLHRQVAPHLHRPVRAAALRPVLRRRCRWARGAGFRSGSSTCSRRSSPRSASRWCSPSFSARTAARRRGPISPIGGVLTGHSARADREGAGSRHRGDAAAGLLRGRLPRRDAHAHLRHDVPLSASRGAGRVEVRAQGLPEIP